MKNATMLFKKGTQIKTDLGEFDYTIVDADDIAEAKKDGWHVTQQEANEADKPKRVTKSKAEVNSNE